MDLAKIEEQMKPCPFCNSMVRLHRTSETSSIYAVACPTHSICSKSGIGTYIVIDQIESALIVWNARAAPN